MRPASRYSQLHLPRPTPRRGRGGRGQFRVKRRSCVEKRNQKVAAAAQRFEEASASFGSFSSNADAQITQFGGEANALIADLRNVTENANTAVEESNRAISAAADAIEGPATDALQDARLASRDLRVLIARLDRVARELEQNPQGFVVGDPAPYEESR